MPSARRLDAKRNAFLDEVRADRQSLADTLKKHPGARRRLVEDLYGDDAHLVEELLQNADDAGASKARFELREGSPSSVTFEHNGRPFSETDIWGITDIGESTKAREEDKIGCYGIGFKSVFAYTETPYIWSPTFYFKLFDFVLPDVIAFKSGLGRRTQFEFPFNSPNKSSADAYAQIEARLRSLVGTTLLFLPNLKAVYWQIGDAVSGSIVKVMHRKNQVEVRTKSTDETTASSHFLLFDEPVVGLKKKRLAIAFELDFLSKVKALNPKKQLAVQMRIRSAEPAGRVAIYFPAGKETSGLRFHLHAPFVPDLSRAYIKKAAANEPLFQQLAKLTATSLGKIREFRLLNADFLEVLPNPEDALGDDYKCIRDAIIDEMNNKPLTPTHNGRHEPAKRLLQATLPLKDLLSDADIGFLIGCDKEAEKPPQWAIGVPPGNHKRRSFLNALAIRNWNVTELAGRLIACTVDGTSHALSEPFKKWLGDKPPEWHQKLYALLYDHLPRDGNRWLDRLKPCRIVRLGDGAPPEREPRYSIGNSCYFPSNGIEHDEEMPRVARAVYESGQDEQQQRAAKQFLVDIDVRPAGEAECIERILQERYAGDELYPQEEDLERFIALVKKEPHRATLFAEYFIFEGTNGKWWRPTRMFLDKPFLDTGLGAYYGIFGDDASRSALAPRYETCGISIERLAEFAKAVGAQTALQVCSAGCGSNPHRENLLSGIKHRSYKYGHKDDDFDIVEFGELTRTPTVDGSRLIWHTMVNTVKPFQLVATYEHNTKSPLCRAPSQLVHRLIGASWVPQKDGTFVRPMDAKRELLREGFTFDEAYEWLGKVRFEEANRLFAEKTRAEENESRAVEAAAQLLGFRDGEQAKRFAMLTQDELELLWAGYQRRQSRELPRHEPSDPKRRAERVRQEAANAPIKTVEERSRSVPVGRDDIKKQAEQYLLEQYTLDGEMTCQICQAPLPFKLDDGTWFFEKVEFLAELTKHHRQNYLALCPNHAAMFLYANGSKDLLRGMIEQLEGDKLVVVLAQRNATVHLTGTHIGDLRAIIDAEREG